MLVVRLTIAFAFFVLLVENNAKGANPSSSPSGQQGGGSQQGGGQGAQQQQNNSSASPAGSPAGITNGTLSIESTILAYSALIADASGIATTLNTKLAKDNVLVIGTSNDIAAIIQLRSVLAQAGVLKQRLEQAAAKLSALGSLPTYSKPAAREAPSVGGGPFIASPSDIATLIQTLGSITAVNENVSSAPAALNDATLISLVADAIDRTRVGSVLVPGVFPPNLMTNTDLGGTYIGQTLNDLEQARKKAVELAMDYSQALADAQTVLAASAAAGYSAADKGLAGPFAEKATAINSTVTIIGTASTAADTFETSLFSGQGSAPSGNTAPNNGGGTNPAAAPALPAPPGAPLAPAVTTNNPTAQGTQLTPTQPGTILQQILYADLLLHSVLLPPGQTVKFMAVHALESGGSQLTKSNLFLGSRYYFSGGAVASFYLYSSDGKLQCSGASYGYRGLVREKDLETAMSGVPHAARVSTTCK